MNSVDITVLGAGQDVGRSCVVVTFPSKRVVFDCGAHCGFVDQRRYPDLQLLGDINEYNHQIQLMGSVKKEEFEVKSVPDDPFSHDYSDKCAVKQEFDKDIYMKNALQKALRNVTNSVDCSIISHFHLDHVGALPFLTEHIGYSGPIYLSYPTRALCPLLLRDSVQVTSTRTVPDDPNSISSINASVKSLLNSHTNATFTPDKRRKIEEKADPWGYTLNSVAECMKRSIPLQLRATETVGNLNLVPYYAGHVLGASMFLSECDGFKVLYTGDFNTIPDKHLGPAKVPTLEPDVLICESTYATFVRQSKRATEMELCTTVHETLINGGKVLIPVFAVGRAQELAIILNNYWNNLSLSFPIYFGGGLSEKATNYYKLHSSWTNNNNITNLRENPFSLRNLLQFDQSFLNDNRPMVLFATPGMVHTGLSLKACKLWSQNPSNLILIPGYCVQGTVGNKLIAGNESQYQYREKSIKTNIGVMNIKCKVRYLSFSAHADSPGILQLIKHIRPKNIVFVHGELESMKRFSKHINSTLKIPVYYPSNGQTIKFTKDSDKKDVREVYVHPNILIQNEKVVYAFNINNNIYLYDNEKLLKILNTEDYMNRDVEKIVKSAMPRIINRIKLTSTVDQFYKLTEFIAKIILNSKLEDKDYTTKASSEGIFSASTCF
ncbi:uncharacterized protein TA05480 [Theileria annulata]|uniref:Cleavage and polyadenylation specificity factor n=1 Tax=Theileria annulata TaxID=5874 RepID=Q4UCQ8_THEAN|nr:uncharacterized protein TA05480 [Theileria annulata]CAI75393.1 hypothetical protein, conserved [Theileria annulata]|eukprot:XP_954869.1 hypothetical protein, conserved [Theileria annulata]